MMKRVAGTGCIENMGTAADLLEKRGSAEPFSFNVWKNRMQAPQN